MKESTLKPTAIDFLQRRANDGEMPYEEWEKNQRDRGQVALILSSQKKRQELLHALQNQKSVRDILRDGLYIDTPQELKWFQDLTASIRPDAKMPDFPTLQKFLGEKMEIWGDISLDYMSEEFEGNNPNHVNITAMLHEGYGVYMGYIDITTGEIVDTTDEEVLQTIAQRKKFLEQMEGNNNPSMQ